MPSPSALDNLLNQEPINLWIGPIKTCIAFGYKPSSKMHKRVTTTEQVEGYYRPIVVHCCNRNGVIGYDIALAISRIPEQFVTRINHKV